MRRRRRGAGEGTAAQEHPCASSPCASPRPHHAHLAGPPQEVQLHYTPRVARHEPAGAAHGSGRGRAPSARGSWLSSSAGFLGAEEQGSRSSLVRVGARARARVRVGVGVGARVRARARVRASVGARARVRVRVKG